MSIRFFSHNSLRLISSTSRRTERVHEVKYCISYWSIIHMDFFLIFFITYVILILLLVRLLPQFPVEVQLAVKHGRCPDAQGEEQQAPQHQACKHTQRQGPHDRSGCCLTFDKDGWEELTEKTNRLAEIKALSRKHTNSLNPHTENRRLRDGRSVVTKCFQVALN